MDSSILTILIYIGGFLLIALVKSIGGANKKKTSVTQEIEKQRKEYDAYYSDSHNASNPFLQEILSGTDEQISFVPNKDKNDLEIHAGDYYKEIPEPDSRIETSQKEQDFILGDFDARSAIIYSEILQRFDY